MYDPQTIGTIIGVTIVGIFGGGLAVYKVIKNNFPMSDDSVNGIKTVLIELEGRIGSSMEALEDKIELTFSNRIALELELVRKENEKIYLSIKNYEKDSELAALRMREYIRITFDECFAIRDKKLDAHFDTIESKIDRNKEVVSVKMDAFFTDSARNREENAAQHAEIQKDLETNDTRDEARNAALLARIQSLHPGQ